MYLHTNGEMITNVQPISANSFNIFLRPLNQFPQFRNHVVNFLQRSPVGYYPNNADNNINS